MFGKIKQIINSGSERSQIVKRNAAGSLFIKFFSMFVDFAKVPVILSYLDSEHYGVYITIASIIYWSHNFDFGLGTGLRYKLTESISLKNQIKGKQLVSTAYISMTAIMSTVFLCALPIIFNLDWQKILNNETIHESELLLSIVFVLFVYMIQFVLELISYILQADQKAAISTVFKPIANLITLIVIFILKLFSYNSLLLACAAMCVPIVIVLLIANIILFYKRYKTIAPSLSDFSRECIRDIYSLGLKYFMSQLSSLIVFNTANFLITYYVNPTETAAYSSAWTYFGVLVILNNMVLQPLVAAVTDAYVKGDYMWIKKCFKKIKLYSVGLTFLSILLLLISSYVFHFWLGDKLEIPISMSVVMSFYFILNIWVSPYLNFLSGVGKLSISALLSIVKIILYIPVAVLLIKSFGTVGLLFAIIMVNTIPNLVISIIQFKLIMERKATGIWNR
ncbi:MAG: MATE family efflux transporter [Bacteroidales bacterium]|nr:MATE family efflux transporter [Bacteroidales bacterium]